MKFKHYAKLVILALLNLYILLMALGFVAEACLLVTNTPGFYLPAMIGAGFSTVVMVLLMLVYRPLLDPANRKGKQDDHVVL